MRSVDHSSLMRARVFIMAGSVEQCLHGGNDTARLVNPGSYHPRLSHGKPHLATLGVPLSQGSYDLDFVAP